MYVCIAHAYISNIQNAHTDDEVIISALLNTIIFFAKHQIEKPNTIIFRPDLLVLMYFSRRGKPSIISGSNMFIEIAGIILRLPR